MEITWASLYCLERLLTTDEHNLWALDSRHAALIKEGYRYTAIEFPNLGGSILYVVSALDSNEERNLHSVRLNINTTQVGRAYAIRNRTHDVPEQLVGIDIN